MSLHKPQYPVLIFWEESWNYTQKDASEANSETIIPDEI